MATFWEIVARSVSKIMTSTNKESVPELVDVTLCTFFKSYFSENLRSSLQCGFPVAGERPGGICQ